MNTLSTIAKETEELTLYSSLPAPTTGALERCAVAIDGARAKTVDALFEIGQQLRLAHDELAHHGDGLFGKWVVQRCGMSRTAAYDAMKVVEVFGEHQQQVCPPGGQTFDVKALSYLSRDTTPDAAIKDALQLAERGEHVTLSKAKKLVAKYTIDAAGTGGTDQNMAPATQTVADFESVMREETRRWWEACAPPHRVSIPDTLRRIADELEARISTDAATMAEAAAEQIVLT